MKKIYILILSTIAVLLIFILVFTQKKSEYIIKPANDPCPEGQKMTYLYTDIAPLIRQTGCKLISQDAGKICTTKSDCINNCVVVDFDKFGCKPHKGGNCPEVVDCGGINGRCEATKDEGFRTIIEQDKVLFSCVGV